MWGPAEVREKIEPGIREMEAEKRMAERELANLNLETSNFIGRSLASHLGPGCHSFRQL